MKYLKLVKQGRGVIKNQISEKEINEIILPLRRSSKSFSRFDLLAGCPLKTIFPFVSINMVLGTPETLY